MLRADRQQVRGRGVIGVVDVGSSKTVCLIAAISPGEAGPANIRIVGLGVQPARGTQAGIITDLDEAERCARAAIGKAERMAGVTLEGVHVSVGCGELKSQTFAANAEIESGVVEAGDIGRLMAGGRSFAERDGRRLVHMNTIGYRLDGNTGASDPRGMAARRVTADLHTVTAEEAPLRNLMVMIERCYLSISGVVASPYASALAVTTEEEQRQGVTCIDIGGGTTKIACFANGQFLHASVIPLGADLITYDIARALQTPLAEAERIKALYGSMIGAQSDEHETFSYALADEEDGGLYQATKAQLARVVAPRVEALLARVATQLDRSGMRPYACGRIVLTGGGSELVGIGPYAANIFGAPVRVGRPMAISGLPQNVSTPAFSTVAGLLRASTVSGAETMAYDVPKSAPPKSYLGRVGQWLMEAL